ncbi:MAG: sugar transferase [Pseudomonadota bacterium]
MRIAITGASGFIGRRLVPHLAQNGYDLLLLGRDPKTLKALFPDHPCTNYDGLDAALVGVESVVHLAAMLPDRKQSDEVFVEANVALTQRLIDVCRRAGVAHIINIATLGWKQGKKHNAYSRTKKQAEGLLHEVEFASVATLRLPAVYDDEGRAPYRGGLAMLNWVPGPAQGSSKGFAKRFAFDVVSSLRPTVSLSTVVVALDAALSKPHGTYEVLVSNGQKNNRTYAVFKRLMDLVGVVLLLGLAGWLMVVIAIVIRLKDGSPVMFRQVRLGRDQRPFLLYKFRTMVQGTPNRATHETPQSAVTSVGRVLRKTKLDELPQIINIARGELSFVGPRPGLPNQTELREAREHQGVFEAFPGLTGLAQIEGIDMRDPNTLAQKDAQYIALRSVILDLKLIFRTIWKAKDMLLRRP